MYFRKRDYILCLDVAELFIWCTEFLKINLSWTETYF
jgi:hypothetical protein